MVDASAGGASLTEPTLAVVIVNYRTPHLVEQCLASLRAERVLLPQLRVILVDGGSGDTSAHELAQMVTRPEFKHWVSFLPLEINGGFGWANNQAILRLARDRDPPDFVYLLNPDAQVCEGALAALVNELQADPGCGAAGSQLLTLDQVPAGSAFRFPSAGREFMSAAQSEKLGRRLGISPIVIGQEDIATIDWVTGASVLLRTDALRQSGLFDDGFFLYFDEVELMHRLRRKGWTARHVPSSRVMHLEGASTGVSEANGALALPDYWYRSRRRYFALTGGRTGLILANLAWVLGRLARLPVSMISKRQKARTRASRLLLPLWPRQKEVTASFPRWGDLPGRPPAWMHQE